MHLTHSPDGKLRCFGSYPDHVLYAEYHDEEWGVPVHDDRMLLEFVVLEGAQAGLNWETVLKKREGYKKAFHNFDPVKVAHMSDEELLRLREDSSIIRNRLKIESARKNARVFLAIQDEFGSFSTYLWGFVNDEQLVNHPKTYKDVHLTTEVSDALSKDLKKRGMSFVGSTIMYAFMQAVGMVDDHLAGCWKRSGSGAG